MKSEPAFEVNSELIRKIRDEGITVVLIEHDMKVVMGISDRITVIDYGVKISEGTPAEVPAEMNAFKSQQHRWAKGTIQTMRKLLPRIWKADLPLLTKLEASFRPFFAGFRGTLV